MNEEYAVVKDGPIDWANVREMQNQVARLTSENRVLREQLARAERHILDLNIKKDTLMEVIENIR